jgi:GDP-4-dehydro-6-deoxy-D-mannose reductase
MVRALITGSSGFTGRFLAKALVDRDWEIAHFNRWSSESNSKTYVGDITHSETISYAVADYQPDVIFHLGAATPHNNPSIETYYHVNVVGTLALLEAVRLQYPNTRVIIITSSAIYGRASLLNPSVNENSVLLPVTPYGVSKAAQHMLGYQYAVAYGLNIIRACTFNLLGPNLPRGLAAADFAYQIAEIEDGKQQGPLIVGNLSSERDFVDVRDAVEAYILLAKQGQAGESYNISSARAVPISYILQLLIAEAHCPIQIDTHDYKPSNQDIPVQKGDNCKIGKLGWMPKYSIEQSVRATLDSVRQKS